MQKEIKNKTIIVCDDDPGIIDIATIVLQNKGYTVLGINDSTIMISEVNKVMPDLILLDLWMPVINGEKLTSLIKSNPQTKDIPVIIFSASRETENVAKVAGADAYITKPFDIDALGNLVDSLLS